MNLWGIRNIRLSLLLDKLFPQSMCRYSEVMFVFRTVSLIESLLEYLTVEKTSSLTLRICQTDLFMTVVRSGLVQIVMIMYIQ